MAENNGIRGGEESETETEWVNEWARAENNER